MTLEFPPWHTGLRILLRWLGSLQRCGFNHQPSTVGESIRRCHSRFQLGFHPWPGELPHAMCEAIKWKKKKKKWLSITRKWEFKINLNAYIVQNLRIKEKIKFPSSKNSKISPNSYTTRFSAPVPSLWKKSLFLGISFEMHFFYCLIFIMATI